MSSRVKQLPPRTLEEVMAFLPAYRQSLLAKADNCMLSTLFDLQGRPFTNAAQARGIIFHRFAVEILRTLWRTGESTVPTEEAIQILYEVSRQADVPPRDVVVVPARERRMLRMCALKLAALPFDVRGLIDIEQTLEAKLSYPQNGSAIERKITGRPDVLLADPPDGVIVLDWKTAPSAPAAGDQPHWSGDHLHVSYGGYFQQRVYGLLVMRNFPAVQRVTLREFYVVPEETREAVVPREALEHVEAELSVIAEALDRALMAGSDSPLWSPSPGVHCSYCRRPQSCPIESEARMAQGAITSAAQAARVAAELAVVDAFRGKGNQGALAALKAWHEATNQPIPVKDARGRHEWRWTKDSKGGRRFKLTAPERNVADDPELRDAFDQAAARKTVTA